MAVLTLPRDGVVLAVEESGSGPPLIFAHGLTGTRRQTQRLVGPLADRHRVITFDQRGHGDSQPVGGPSVFDPNAMASDIVAILDALGEPRAVVGGTSMGAATALLCALRHPERVTRLILAAPAFGDAPNPASRLLEEMGEEIARTGLAAYIARLRQHDWPAAGMTEEAMDFRAGMLLCHDAASVAAACAVVANWVLLNDLAPLAGLTMPVQIIAWEGDPVHPWELAERLAGALPCSQLVRATLAPYHNEPGFLARLARPFLCPSDHYFDAEPARISAFADEARRCAC